MREDFNGTVVDFNFEKTRKYYSGIVLPWMLEGEYPDKPKEPTTKKIRDLFHIKTE